MKLAKLGELTAESAPLEEQIWHTYEPVAVPSAEGVIAAITKPETWPDYATEIGRFTPLRAGGLAGQTFEIEVAANTRTALPVFTRGYVTITSLVTPDDPKALREWFEALEVGMEKYGNARIVPEGGEPLVGFDLTTHRGHFMGSGHNRLALYTLDGQAYLRAAGTWDPMPWHLDKAYKAAGSDAQHAFWGAGEDPSLSMLHQIAPKWRSTARAGAHERRGRHRRRAQRPRGRDPARRGRPPGARARGRRQARRRGPHRGADAPGLQARHVLLRVSRERRLARVRPHAAGRARAGVGAPGGGVRPPAARRRGEAALRRPRSAPRASLGGRDGENWVKFAKPFLDNFEAVRATMLSGFPPVGGPVKLLAGAGPLRLLDFTRMLPGSAVGLGKRLFDDGGSRAWLYGAAMHGDTPPDGAGSGIAAFYLNLLGHAVGWPSPRGGAERLTDALVSYFTSLGGELRTGVRVERVLSANGRVTGVTSADERFAATTVIADVMPAALMRMTALPELVHERAEDLRPRARRR